MRLADKILVSLAMAVVLSSGASAATITGSVTGPDGKPFMGAFVVAENTQNKMTVSVLSDEQGRYHIGNLPAATYTVKITAIGYKSDPRTDVRLTADQKTSFDFALQKGTGALERSDHLSGPASFCPRPRNTTSATRTFSSRPASSPAIRFKSAWRAGRVGRGGWRSACQLHARRR